MEDVSVKITGLHKYDSDPNLWSETPLNNFCRRRFWYSMGGCHWKGELVELWAFFAGVQLFLLGGMKAVQVGYVLHPVLGAVMETSSS